MARGGEVFRNMRTPQVARDGSSGVAVITLNGAEDEFVVLSMAEAVADELTDKLIAAGYDKRPR